MCVGKEATLAKGIAKQKKKTVDGGTCRQHTEDKNHGQPVLTEMVTIV